MMNLKKMKYILFLLIVPLLLFPIHAREARAESKTIIIHYQRGDGDYGKWNIWAWPDGKDGAAYPFNDEDSYGMVAVIEVPNADERVGFIVRTDAWDKDVADDRFIDLALGNEIWVTTGRPEFSYEPPEGYEYEVIEYDELEIIIHRHRYDGAYNEPEVAIKMETGETYLPDRIGSDAFGEIYKNVLPNVGSRQKESIRFAIEWGPEGGDFMEYELAFNRVPEGANALSIFSVQGRRTISYNDAPEINKTVLEARIDGPDTMSVRLSYPALAEGEDLAGKFILLSDGEPVPFEIKTILTGVPDVLYVNMNPAYATQFILSPSDGIFSLGGKYTVAFEGYEPAAAVVGDYFNSEGFEALYTFEGELGAIYSKESTVFRLWSPTASGARVNLYPTGDGSEAFSTLEMKSIGNGAWEAALEGDQKNIYYTYSVEINGRFREAIDPYARAAGVNGKRGMVVDLSETDPPGWDSYSRKSFGHPTEAVIYELHVRDFSISENSGMVNKGKYLAFTESGTVNSSGLSTGVDHLVELGVTHVHLLPVFDFRSVDESKPELNNYNWGYDPENYNLPEGSYSTDPYDGNVRIVEFKKMVQSLHENGLRVVMDVVYNHTGASSDSNLNRLVPDYYYRQNASGGFSNGSGCGNETASERSMVRRLIVDSVVYWAKEYKIDGFRFDLMALHDIETMNAVRAALDEIDPSILVYGEGWTGGGTPLPALRQASKANAKYLNERITVFSDDMRDGIKGSVFIHDQPGYVNGNYGRREEVKFGVAASVMHPQIDYGRVPGAKVPWAAAPSQTINYASAHDNLTLWDKLSLTRPEADDSALVAMNKLSALLVLTSQGIPFFQAGEEFARSKGGNDNSYNAPDSVNRIDWDNKTEYFGLFEYYKGLIELRKSHPAFRFRTADEIAENIYFIDTEAQLLAYALDGESVGDRSFVVAVNVDNKERKLTLPGEGWSVLVNGDKAGLNELSRIEGDVLNLAAKTGYVLTKIITEADEIIETPTDEERENETAPSPTTEPSPTPQPAAEEPGITPEIILEETSSKKIWPWFLFGGIGLTAAGAAALVRKRK